MIVICKYCGKRAVLVNGDVIYPERPELKDRKYWHCEPCDAYVGTHEDSKDHKPFGTLANAELRVWRTRAHKIFNPLVEGKIERDGCSFGKAKRAGYAWLAGKVGVEVKDCHIGMFDIEKCQKAITICHDQTERMKHGITSGA